MDNLGIAMQELFDEQTAELLQDIDRSEPAARVEKYCLRGQFLCKRVWLVSPVYNLKPKM